MQVLLNSNSNDIYNSSFINKEITKTYNIINPMLKIDPENNNNCIIRFNVSDIVTY